MIIENKNLIQSYIFTTAKYDFSVYEKRIMYFIVDSLRRFHDNKKLDGVIVQTNMFYDVDIVMPISYILQGDDDKNHIQVKKALISLGTKKIETETEIIYELIMLLERVQIKKYEKNISFRLHHKVARAILDFSKGYRKFELKTTFALKSIYAMRFYELLSKQESPISFSIQRLREMFQLENKYNQTKDFIKWVIASSKKELDEKSPYSFDYTISKTGRKITSIIFYPTYYPEREDPELRTKNQGGAGVYLLKQGTKMVLEQDFDFTVDGMRHNMELLLEAQRSIPRFHEWLCIDMKKSIKSRADIVSKQGYLISCIKQELKKYIK